MLSGHIAYTYGSLAIVFLALLCTCAGLLDNALVRSNDLHRLHMNRAYSTTNTAIEKACHTISSTHFHSFLLCQPKWI
ncbi:hypothetical protein BDF22DRAFT_691218 [Syncephalis plumigaleata]|nr:hypothetical protein BDF22DRAFT_691218 [Syncephalis plumigaleata]